MPRIRRPRLITVPYNAKIADITEADTNKHTLNLATALGETRKIIGVMVGVVRQAGSGTFLVYPNEGNREVDIQVFNIGTCILVIIKDGTQRLQYAQTEANNDYDLYCFGYVVEA